MILGVDVGKTGAIAALLDGQLAAVHDMPVAGNIVSAALLRDICDEYLYATLGGEGIAIIEDVHAMPKQGVTSSFSFGRSLGVVEGVLAGAGWSLRYVSPAKWKRALGLTSDKGACRRRACELWPNQSPLFARVKDDGRAEAALIAHWWQTKGAT